jgi:cellulose synthase/poly-beta-1,6-N-acetylglucosamine synthase-like glycosyltransferase
MVAPPAKEIDVAEIVRITPPGEAARPAQCMVAWMSAGAPDHRFTASLTGALLYDKELARINQDRICSVQDQETGPRVAHARNVSIASFLTSRVATGNRVAEWLVFIDADMNFESHDIHRLLESAEEHDAKVMGALCFAGGRTGCWPTIYSLDRTDDGELDMGKMFRPPLPDNVTKVGGTGAAFLAVHREVLIKMGEAFPQHPDPWFEDHSVKGKSVGEDIMFCLRAQAVGYDVWIDPRIEIGHIKRYDMNRAFWEGLHGGTPQ